MREQGTTTKAASDLYLDLKVIKLEINKFKAEKEIVERELKEVQEARNIVQQETRNEVKILENKNKVLNDITLKLQKEINKLTESKDELEEVVGLRKSEVLALKDEKKKISENTDVSFKEFKKVVLESENLKVKSNQEIKLLNEEIKQRKEELDKLKKENEIELQRNTDLQKEYNDRKEFLNKEDIRLATKGSDLHIYEARLRKKYLELMPDVEIVV